ncbi:YkvA family protein [Thermocoleostomius sinensis]|uniref:YkvA family protein n=1 Tax=Thermocoleostomius sinensis A174 TaxID=2016057 RepID=A0A9E9CAR5_9CYAN|nr:YkvA family protein [Thermocoleostomius sinensis]WAL61337.1 YkvA family protein [Thermocoleostomius sinensis A174]
MATPNGQYSEQDFWRKLKDFAVYAGKEVVEKALVLFYAAQRPETPVWAKTVIYAALAYFILPTDAVPDFIPAAGYSDDLASLIAALGAVAICITPEVQQAAKQKVEDWFGKAQSTSETATASPSNDTPRTIPID